MHKPKMRKSHNDYTPRWDYYKTWLASSLSCFTVNKILQGEQLFSRVPLLDEISTYFLGGTEPHFLHLGLLC